MKKILLMWISVSLSTYFVQAQQVSPGMIAGENVNHEKEGRGFLRFKKHNKKTLRKLAGTKVSEQSQATFYVQFGNVKDVQWERQDYFDVAAFDKDGQHMKAYFDNDGEMVGTSIQTNLKALPVKAQLEIAKNTETIVLRMQSFMTTTTNRFPTSYYTELRWKVLTTILWN